VAELPRRAIADTSVFIAQESGRPLGALPAELAVSTITVGELELGVLRAPDPEARARRLATLAQVRAAFFLLPIDDVTASCFARLGDEAISAGQRPSQNDLWIAATAMRHGVAVVTQDDDFAAFGSLAVIHV
jgi:predicted nucleic acid-binding protein